MKSTTTPPPSPMGSCLNVCIFVITNAFFHNYVQLPFYFLKCQTCLKSVTEMSTFKTRAILGGWGWSLFALVYSICIKKTNTHTRTHTRTLYKYMYTKKSTQLRSNKLQVLCYLSCIPQPYWSPVSPSAP